MMAVAAALRLRLLAPWWRLNRTSGASSRHASGAAPRLLRRWLSHPAAGDKDQWARVLTGQIKATQSSEGLLALVERHGGEMDAIHVSASWAHLAGGRVGGGDSEAVAAALQLVTARRVDEMGARSVANTLWALAKLPRVIPDPRLLKELQRRAVAEADRFTPQNVANTLWALATLGVAPEAKLLEAMQRRAVAEADRFNPQAVANTLWALAVWGQCGGAGVESLVDQLLSFAEHDLHRDALPQVHQFLLSCELDIETTPAVQRLKDRLGPKVLETFRDTIPTVSKLQGAVARSLATLYPGSVLEEEATDKRSGYDIDIVLDAAAIGSPFPGPADAGLESGIDMAVVQELVNRGFPKVRAKRAAQACGADVLAATIWILNHHADPDIDVDPGGACEGGRKGVAVEVDGPSHYLAGTQQPTGSTLMKRRHLRQLGWELISVPYWEWGAIEKAGVDAQRDYWAEKLGQRES
jgi:hypothetical protein